jgi:hypothetical protein
LLYNLCDGIWAGPYPYEAAIRKLTNYGVKTFVNLTRADEKLFFGLSSYRSLLSSGAQVFRFPLWSHDLPVIDELLPVVEVLINNRPSYLHCRQGLDRTGVVAVLTLMKRGMGWDSALEHLKNVRDEQSEPSPRKNYHLRYLKNADAFLNGGAWCIEKNKLFSERTVLKQDELTMAIREEVERITVIGTLAKRVHRAMRGLNALVGASVQMSDLDLGNAKKLHRILTENKLGLKQITAILARIGPRLSYALAKDYREISYCGPDEDHGKDHEECVLELKE